MKISMSALFGSLVLASTLPAVAGPDRQALAQAREHRQAQAALTVAAAPACETRRLVLPLDHGPRAQSTPYLNAQIKARFEAEAKACAATAAQASASR